LPVPEYLWSLPGPALLFLALNLLLFVTVVALPLLKPPKAVASSPKAWRPYRASYLLTFLVCSLVMLSGCGTKPSVPYCPPVPAELLTPPQAPVPLHHPIHWQTPGSTTSPTPAAAPSTASGMRG
jgi:hypothetical protein